MYGVQRRAVGRREVRGELLDCGDGAGRKGVFGLRCQLFDLQRLHHFLSDLQRLIALTVLFQQQVLPKLSGGLLQRRQHSILPALHPPLLNLFHLRLHDLSILHGQPLPPQQHLPIRLSIPILLQLHNLSPLRGSLSHLSRRIAVLHLRGELLVFAQ